jgi:formate dehydrogenase accessory protein FdhE
MTSIINNKECELKNSNPASSDLIARRLAEIHREAPELGDVVRTYGAILPLLHDADLRVTPVTLTQEQARKKLEAGFPLLHDMDIEFDLQAMADLLVALVNRLGSNGDQVAAPSIQAALEKGSMDALNFASLAAAGDEAKIREIAMAKKLDPDLLWTLAKFALKPVYYAVRRQVEHLIEEAGWDSGSCPICGAGATLGELRDNNLEKHLRCNQCGAGWRTSRLQCHICENEDHRTLGFLYTEDKQGNVRVDVCDHCKDYLKVITTFSPITPEMIAIEDLATLSLDYAAQKSGYVCKLRSAT